MSPSTALAERTKAVDPTNALSGAPGSPHGENVGVWWLTPAGVVTLVVPATLALAWFYPDEVYRRAWGAAKSLTWPTVVSLAAASLVFIAVSLLVMALARRLPRAGWPRLDSHAIAVLRRASTVLFVLTIVGYLALLAAGLARGARPGDILARLFGGDVSADALKSQFAPITGITSLTQMGIGLVIVAALLLVVAPSRREVIRLVVVVLLALLRAVVVSERLAIIEIVLPLLAVGAMAAANEPRLRTWLRWAPLLLVPLGALVFAGFEYGRSWVYYRSQGEGSFMAFATERLAGYYATAYNNGQLLLDQNPPSAPYLSVQGLWEAPGVAQSGIYGWLNPAGPGDFSWLLSAYANPEFNNPCGLCLPLHDFGLLGGIAFFALASVLVTLVFVAFWNAHPVGLLAYPALFTGLWELPRYLYWTQGRLLPVLAVLVVVGLLALRRAR